MAIGSILTKIPVMPRMTLLYMYQTKFLAFESNAVNIIVPNTAKVMTSPMPDVMAATRNAIDFTVRNAAIAIIAAKKIAPVTPSGLSQNDLDLYPSIYFLLYAKGVTLCFLHHPEFGLTKPDMLLQNRLQSD